MIDLVDVYRADRSIEFLYALLGERKVSESISHKRHPSFVEHEHFVRSRPYLGWHLIRDGTEYIGCCYITKMREVGIWLLPGAKGRGAGSEAMRQLLALYPGRVFTNTAIHNTGAFAFYSKCGFRHCANMLEHDNVPGGGNHPGPAGIDQASSQSAVRAWGDAIARLDGESGKGSRDRG